MYTAQCPIYMHLLVAQQLSGNLHFSQITQEFERRPIVFVKGILLYNKILLDIQRGGVATIVVFRQNFEQTWSQMVVLKVSFDHFFQLSQNFNKKTTMVLYKL